jgi:mannose-6-phosphate isomerase-like protein (cupin superfamily)
VVTGVRPFPGGIGLTHLRVYDSEGPDGLRGGTPHVHTACTEAYAVVAGSGAVQTLTPQGFEVTPLEPGTFVWFTPGTIHRLVNDGDLEILVLMGNAGLPEAGDMVICFPDEVLADESAYRAAATLPDGERTTAGSGDAARARRDLGVQGFTDLKDAMASSRDGAPLVAFYERVGALVAPLAAGWRPVWEAGPLEAALRTGEQLTALADGDPSHLRSAAVAHLGPPPDERTMGCCGTLGTYVVPT